MYMPGKSVLECSATILKLKSLETNAYKIKDKASVYSPETMLMLSRLLLTKRSEPILAPITEPIIEYMAVYKDISAVI